MKNSNQWQYEEIRLAEIVSIAKHQLEEGIEQNEVNKADILMAKKELREESSHFSGNLWSSDGFEAMAEMSQFANTMNQRIVDFEIVENRINQLKHLIKVPYFARIDFKFDDEDTFEPIYIGRSSLEDSETEALVVYDWRAPIASVFYRFVLGKAFYDAPVGRIHGETNLKRQFEIKESALEYFFDADVQIVDEFLRKLLSQNASTSMKAIVETIQRDQDIVIRDMENDLMMVQGVAGSGKTSIALHRAAYLMYQGLTNKLSANNILIISPSTLFERYIAAVLPELGEHQVSSVIFDEIAVEILGIERIESRYEFLETLMCKPPNYTVIKSCISFKTSIAFVEMLNQYIKDLPQSRIERESVIVLYKDLFENQTAFDRYIAPLESEENAEAVRIHTLNVMRHDKIPYDDAIVLTYMHLKLHGTQSFRGIKQVVIDEAQDYYPMQFEIFNLLFPKSKFTILGDINQTLEKKEKLSLYDQISKQFNKTKSSLVSMNKSFRCSSEILNYSLQFLQEIPEINSFNRHGDAPQLISAESTEQLNRKILEEISHCQASGYQSIGLLCKSERNAKQLYENLADHVNLSLITAESTEKPSGLFLMPIYLSKGLEFDAVLICDVNQALYHSADDKNLLYIGCSRALHRLNLFASDPIQQEVPVTSAGPIGAYYHITKNSTTSTAPHTS